MKPSVRLLLGGGLVAAATAALFSCRTQGPSGGDVKETVPDGPQFSTMKLTMAADSETAEISADFDFGPEFRPGDSVELRWDVVRSEEELTIKCSALRGKDTVTLQGDSRHGTFRKTVDKALFESPYRQDPKNEAKADMSAFVGKSGRLRVEGCLIKPGFAAPLAEAKAEPGKGGLGLAGVEEPIVQFGKICAERLGALPAFDCLDDTLFKEMAVTQTGPGGTTKDMTESVDKCDRPIYLPTGGGYCKPWARVGRIQVNADTWAGVVCRRYWSSDYPPINGKDDPFFNDVAVIQHNKKTGETCFFQALGYLYGRRVPPPNEPELAAEVKKKHPQAKPAKTFWLPPQNVANITCIGCHDADPFMHSPYIDQPKTAEGDTWLPNAPRSKYIILGGKFGFNKWPTSYSVKPQGNSECTSCHRIGSLQGCEVWAQDSGGLGGYLKGNKTAFGKAYPQSHWMPTADFGDLPTLATWKTEMGPAHKAIIDCCNVKRADGSRILGKQSDFASMTPNYPSPMPQSDIDRLKAAGCLVAPISEVKATF